MSELPEINQKVLGIVRYTRNWPECFSGLKITDKEIYIKRIKSSANSVGWQWSGAEFDTFINGQVISWTYLPIQLTLF